MVAVRLGSGGSVAVLLRSAVAFLRCAGSGGFQVFLISEIHSKGYLVIKILS